jgi:DNA-binding MarR family transcriptional regulator
VVAVRDSKDRRGPVLRLTPDQWRAFTAAVKTGELTQG